MTSRNVWALGALRFNSIARVAKRRICTVAPEAYQNGPLVESFSNDPSTGGCRLNLRDTVAIGDL